MSITDVSKADEPKKSEQPATKTEPPAAGPGVGQNDRTVSIFQILPTEDSGQILPASQILTLESVPPPQTYGRPERLDFPALSRGNGMLVKIKYLSKWQEATKAGKSGIPKDRRYVGFQGRELEFSTLLDDLRCPVPAQKTINTLIRWATMLTYEANMDITIQSQQIILKKGTPKEIQKQVADFARSLQNSTFSRPKDNVQQKYGKYIEKNELENVGTRNGMAKLNTPIAPFPLRVKLGSMVIYPCVIKEIGIDVRRYGDTQDVEEDERLRRSFTLRMSTNIKRQITSAMVTVALQEIRYTDSWRASEVVAETWSSGVSIDGENQAPAPPTPVRPVPSSSMSVPLASDKIPGTFTSWRGPTGL